MIINQQIKESKVNYNYKMLIHYLFCTWYWGYV